MSMTLKLPADYSMNQRDNQYQRREQQDKKLLDLKHWFKAHYPQLVIQDIPFIKLEKMYKFIQENGGLYAKPKQAPKKERMFMEMEYYVKLSEAHQAGKKIGPKHLMNLFKMELQQLSHSDKKLVLRDFEIGREFRETMQK